MSKYTQTDADSAYAYLAFADARRKGLVQGGPPINERRARQILRECAERGIRPDPQAPARLIAELQKLGENTPKKDGTRDA